MSKKKLMYEIGLSDAILDDWAEQVFDDALDCPVCREAAEDSAPFDVILARTSMAGSVKSH